MKKVGTLRFNYFFGFTLIAFLLGLAEYLEIYKAMTPCPLCMLQRVVLISLGAIFFMGMMMRTRRIGHICLSLLGLMASLGGILLSGRQVWLQYVPHPGLGECGANLSYIFKALPFKEALKQIWVGGVECSQQGSVFLHLTLAEWSLVGFIGFMALALIQFKRSLDA